MLVNVLVGLCPEFFINHYKEGNAKRVIRFRVLSVVLILVKMLISVVHLLTAGCAAGYIPDGGGGCVVCDSDQWVAAGMATAGGSGQGQCLSK